MVYRSALLGFLIALVVTAGLFFPASNRRLADRLQAFISSWAESRRATETGEEADTPVADIDLPPALFPAYPEEVRAPAEPPQAESRAQRVRMTKEPKHREISSGSDIRFSITVENATDATLHMLMVEERFDGDLLTVEDAGEGGVAPNAIAWTIPELGAGERWIATYDLALAQDAAPGTVETTAFVSGADLEGTASAPRLATSMLTVVSLPKTGVDLPLWARLWEGILP